MATFQVRSKINGIRYKIDDVDSIEAAQAYVDNHKNPEMDYTAKEIEQYYENVVAQNPVQSRLSVASRGIPFAGEYIDEAAGSLYGPEAMETIRTQRKAMEETRPFQSGALEMATGVLTTAPIAAKTFVQPVATGAKGLLQRSAQVAVPSAVEGFVSGYGSETGDLIARDPLQEDSGLGINKERLQSAQSRGMIQTALSTILNIPAAVAENIVRINPTRNLDKLAEDLGISKEAAQIVSNITEVGATPEQTDQILRMMGEEARVAQMGPAYASMLDAAKSFPIGEAPRTIARAMDKLGTQTRNRFDFTLDQILGRPEEGPKTIFRLARERTADQRERAYQDAHYQTEDVMVFNGRSMVPEKKLVPRTIQYKTTTSTGRVFDSREGKVIKSIINRIPKRYKEQAIEYANEQAIADNVDSFGNLALDITGNLTSDPTVMQLDYVKRSLQRIVKDNTDSISGKIEGDGVVANTLQKQLNNVLKRVSPQYKKAANLGLESIDEEAAIKLIGKFNTAEIEDFTELMRNIEGPALEQMQDSMKRMFRTHIQSIEDKARSTLTSPNASVDDLKGAVSTLTALSSAAAKKKMGKFMSTREMNRTQRELRRIQEVANLQLKIRAGSPTAPRTESFKIIKEAMPDGFFSNVSEGNGITAIQDMWQGLFGEGEAIKADKVAQVLDEVAQILIGGDGYLARKSAKIIQDIKSGNRLSIQDAKDAGAILYAGIWSIGDRGAAVFQSEEAE